MSKWILILILLASPYACAQDATDPTRPQGYGAQSSSSSQADAQQTNIQLSAVFITGSNRLAVINNQTVAVGETFREYTVVDIQTGSVILQSAGIRKEILINNQSIKKDASNDF